VLKNDQLFRDDTVSGGGNGEHINMPGLGAEEMSLKLVLARFNFAIFEQDMKIGNFNPDKIPKHGGIVQLGLFFLQDELRNDTFIENV